MNYEIKLTLHLDDWRIYFRWCRHLKFGKYLQYFIIKGIHITFTAEYVPLYNGQYTNQFLKRSKTIFGTCRKIINSKQFLFLPFLRQTTVGTAQHFLVPVTPKKKCKAFSSIGRQKYQWSPGCSFPSFFSSLSSKWWEFLFDHIVCNRTSLPRFRVMFTFLPFKLMEDEMGNRGTYIISITIWCKKLSRTVDSKDV